MKRFLTITLLVVGLFSWIYFAEGQTDKINKRKQHFISGSGAGDESGKRFSAHVDRLQQNLKGWPEATVVAVRGMLGEANEDLLNSATLMQQLQAFKPETEPMSLLAKQPQCLGILLILDPADRAPFAKSVLAQKQTQQDLLASSFMKYVSTADIRGWAQAVTHHGRLLSELLQISPTWPLEAAFTFDRDPSHAKAIEDYDRWLEEALAPAGKLRAPDEAASMLQCVIDCGPEIFKKLKGNAEFRAKFHSEIWGKVARAIEKQAANLRTGSDKSPVWHLSPVSDSLWELMLHEPNGEKIFEKQGALAADLLYSKEKNIALPAKLHDRAVSAILGDNQLLLSAMMHYGHDELFQELAARLVKDEDLANACTQLNAAGDGYSKLLNEWHGIRDDKSLVNHLGPPPSPIITAIPGAKFVYALAKYSQGRPVPPWEVMKALTDVVGVTKMVSEATSVTDLLLNVGSKFKINVQDELTNGINEAVNKQMTPPTAPKQLDPIAQYRKMREAVHVKPGTVSRDFNELDPEVASRLKLENATLSLLTDTRSLLQLGAATGQSKNTRFREQAGRMAEECLKQQGDTPLWQAHSGAWFLHLAACRLAAS